jgi:hypothetical protein
MSLFRRRVRASRFRHVREFFWPSLGFRRSSLYLAHRIRRLPDSPYSIAAGLACGTAAAVTPFIGLHVAIGAVFAWLMRANMLAAALGTLVCNPLTFLLILFWLYRFGNWMLGHPAPKTLPAHITFDYIIHSWHVLLPMCLGAVPTAIGVWILTFVPVRALIAGYQRRRHQRRFALREGRQRRLGPETATDQEPRG